MILNINENMEMSYDDEIKQASNMIDECAMNLNENQKYINPIMNIKANPETIPVGMYEGNYYIDMDDIITYMEAANISSVVEALNNIISSYNESSIDADNLCVVLSERSIGYEDILVENDIMYEAGMKIRDASTFGKKTFTKLVTAIKAKAKTMKGDKQGAVADYDKAIAKCKEAIKRIDEEAKDADAGTIKAKQFLAQLANSIPYAVLAATGSVISMNTLFKKGRPSAIGFLFSLTAGIGSAGVTTTPNWLLSDAKATLAYLKSYYEGLIKDLEKAKAKLQ